MALMSRVPKFPVPPALARLSRWIGRPQTHIVGLFLSLMASLAVVAFAIATLEYTKTRGKLLLTAFLVAGYFVTMLAATGIPWRELGLRLRPAAMAAASAALLLLLLGLWGTPDSNAFWKSAAIATLLALGLTLTGVTLARASGGKAAVMFAGIAAALSTMLAGMSAVGVALEIIAPVYWWVFVLLSLCWLAATIALMAARAWRRRAGPS